MVKEEYENFEALRHEFEHFPLLDSTFQISVHSSFLHYVPSEFSRSNSQPFMGGRVFSDDHTIFMFCSIMIYLGICKTCRIICSKWLRVVVGFELLLWIFLVFCFLPPCQLPLLAAVSAAAFISSSQLLIFRVWSAECWIIG